MKLSEELSFILATAYHEAKNRKHEFVTPEHILFASLFFESGAEIILHCGGNVEKLKQEILDYFKSDLVLKSKKNTTESLAFQSVIERAVLHSTSAHKKIIDIGDVFFSIFEESDSFAAYLLQKQGIDKYNLLNYISHGISVLGQPTKESSKTEEEAFFSHNKSKAFFGTNPKNQGGKPKKFLETFATDLTELAKKQTLDPLIGREKDLEQMMRVLCRRYKNNPVLLGEPGVGKTALAFGLANAIVEKKAPPILLNSRIFSIDMGSMLAGTKYRGDFEERFKGVLAELEKIPDAILFIDEIHALVGAGAVQGGAMDASHLLKPILTTGKMRFIGASTYEEYKKYFEKDRALARRFQKIELLEPTIEETILILEGLKPKYEEFHHVTYTNLALQNAATLSAKYLHSRYLPDKAIDLLDEAGAYARMQQKGQDKASLQKKQIIDGEDIEKLIAKMAKIPEKTISQSDNEKLKNLKTDLESVVFGQEQAIQLVCTAIKTSRAGFREPEKPIASFLFVGPTGVGKTELAQQLAHNLGVPLHRFDMSEYEEKHTVARLIGAPPGYVGFDQGGLLTDAVSKHPYSVVLLDEIEKAHPDIFNILLQVMDYATLTDNNGRKADFRNVVLIMTSNAGARAIGKPSVGFSGEEQSFTGALKSAIDKLFSPEFRNRLDSIVPFNSLSLTMIEKIVEKFLNQFQKQLAEKNIQAIFDTKVYQWLAQKSYSPLFGAREVSRIIQEHIKAPFIDETLFGKLVKGGKAHIKIKKDSVSISFESASN